MEGPCFSVLSKYIKRKVMLQENYVICQGCHNVVRLRHGCVSLSLLLNLRAHEADSEKCFQRFCEGREKRKLLKQICCRGMERNKKTSNKGRKKVVLFMRGSCLSCPDRGCWVGHPCYNFTSSIHFALKGVVFTCACLFKEEIINSHNITSNSVLQYGHKIL
jgi:hypothetical protein